MRRAVRWGFFILPILLIVLSVAIPMPLRLSMAGIIFGLLFFQLALVGSFDHFLPNTRRYLALRSEVDRLLQLVRELNATAVEGRRIGEGNEQVVRLLVEELHQCVDRLPKVAGREEIARRSEARDSSQYGQVH